MNNNVIKISVILATILGISTSIYINLYSNFENTFGVSLEDDVILVEFNLDLLKDGGLPEVQNYTLSKEELKNLLINLSEGASLSGTIPAETGIMAPFTLKFADYNLLFYGKGMAVLTSSNSKEFNLYNVREDYRDIFNEYINKAK